MISKSISNSVSNFTYHSDPVRIVFGAGSVAALREEADRAEAARLAAEAAEAAKPADLTRTKGEFGGSMRSAPVWLFKPFDKSQLTAADWALIAPHIHQTAVEVALRSFIRAGGRVLEGVEIYEDRKVM